MNKRLFRVLLDKLKRSFEMMKALTLAEQKRLRAWLGDLLPNRVAAPEPAVAVMPIPLATTPLPPTKEEYLASVPTSSLGDLPRHYLPALTDEEWARIKGHAPTLTDLPAVKVTGESNALPAVVKESTPDPRIYTTDPEQEVAETVAKQGTDAIEARSVRPTTDKIMARPITGAIPQVEARPKPITGKLAATKLKPAKSPYIRHRQSGTAICEAMREALALFEVKHATTRIDHVKMTSLGAMCLRMADSVGQYTNLKIEETNSLPDGDRLAFDEIMVVGPTTSGWLL